MRTPQERKSMIFLKYYQRRAQRYQKKKMLLLLDKFGFVA